MVASLVDTQGMNLWDFIEVQKNSAHTRSLWFEEEKYRVYLRAGDYHFNPIGAPRFHRAIGIGNIIVAEEHRRAGVFTELVAQLMEHGRKHGYTFLRIEGVGHDFLRAWCIRNRFERYNECDGHYTYYKVLR